MADKNRLNSFVNQSSIKKATPAEVILQINSDETVTNISSSQINILVSKTNLFEFSSPKFQFNTSKWLKNVPDTLKLYKNNS